MKKLLSKRVLIPLAVVAVTAICATVAYAWWSATTSDPNNSVSTGSVSLATGGLPITVSNLVPQLDPAADQNGTVVTDAGYPSVSYFYVHNTSSIPLMFYGYLSGGNDPNGIRPYVHVHIWLQSQVATPAAWTTYPAGWADTFQAGGPYTSFNNTLDHLWSGTPAGLNYLSSRAPNGGGWIDTPIGAGEYGVYRVAVWLDKNAPNSTQSSTVSFTINFTGMQQGEWDANNYDGTPFDPNL